MNKLNGLGVLVKKPLQQQMDEKREALRKLIQSKIKKGTFYLQGSDDEEAYFKALSVLKEEIKELEDKIYEKLNKKTRKQSR